MNWRIATGFAWNGRRQALAAAGNRREDVVLAKPQTYMNLSGFGAGAAGKVRAGREGFAGVVDEAQLPLGTIRFIRTQRGSHNGAKSVIGSLARRNLRGCASVAAGSSAEQPQEYVLRPMKKAELEIAAEMIGEAATPWR